MKVIIEDDYLAKLYRTGRSEGKPLFNREIEIVFIRRIAQMEQAENANVLRAIKSLHLEKLTADLDGKYSIRVNKGFRIIFRIEKDDVNIRLQVICVEELNNHYS